IHDAPELASAFRWRGYARVQREKYDLALADYTETIRLEPTNPVYFDLRGGVYAKNKSDFAPAIADYTEAIRLQPAESRYLLNRGRAYVSAKQLDKALEDLNKAVALDPREPNCWVERGHFYHNEKQMYLQAIADYDQAMKLRPGLPE